MSFRFRFLLGWEYRCFPLSVICGSAPRSSRIAPPLGGGGPYAVPLWLREPSNPIPSPFLICRSLLASAHIFFPIYVPPCRRGPYIPIPITVPALPVGERPISSLSVPAFGAGPLSFPFPIYVRRSAAVLLRLRSAELSHSRLPLGGAHIHLHPVQPYACRNQLITLARLGCGNKE